MDRLERMVPVNGVLVATMAGLLPASFSPSIEVLHMKS